MHPLELAIPDQYHDIFDQRAGAYHDAMQRFPRARKNEFEAILAISDIKAGQFIADIPSGGGYLVDYIEDASVQVLAIESSWEFHARCQTSRRLQKLFTPMAKLQVDDNSVDTIVSIAGLHHVVDRRVIFGEFRRILKPGGKLCLADVRAGSPADGFLNKFVDAHNSMGHAGTFIDIHFKNDLEAVGLQIELDNFIEYTWDFEHPAAMGEYAALLFGLDRASPMQVLQGISKHTGYSEDRDGCHMNWGLELIRCRS